jgi:hypothetical protein
VLATSAAVGAAHNANSNQILQEWDPLEFLARADKFSSAKTAKVLTPYNSLHF